MLNNQVKKLEQRIKELEAELSSLRELENKAKNILTCNDQRPIEAVTNLAQMYSFYMGNVGGLNRINNLSVSMDCLFELLFTVDEQLVN